MRAHHPPILLTLVLLASACTPRVELAVPNEPININLNVKIEHGSTSRSTSSSIRSSTKTADCSEESHENLSETGQPAARARSGAAGRRHDTQRDHVGIGHRQGRRSARREADGYLGVVESRGDAEEIASQINQARRAEYHRVAKQNGVSVGDVEAIAGKKAIEKTPPGQIIQLNGNWVRK
ncbi:hypothetical protein SSTU70S_01729 [Stutzerimonas stutzeri]